MEKNFNNNKNNNKIVTKKDNNGHNHDEFCDAGNVVNTTRNAKYTAGHTEGNIFTGKQISVLRDYEMDRAISQEDIKSWWQDMRNHVIDFKNGLQSDAYAHQGFQIPMFDKSGKQIVGQENIKAEVNHQTQAWITEYGSKPLSTHNINDVHLDMSGNMRTTIKDIKGNDADRILGFSEQGSYPQITDQNYSSKITEITDNKAEVGNKRSHQDTVESEGNKIIKRSENKIRNLNKDELISLNEQLSGELEARNNNETGSSNLQGFSTSELRETKLKYEQALNANFSSSPTANNDDKISVGGIIIAIFGGISVLVIGSIALVKSKLSKSNKK